MKNPTQRLMGALALLYCGPILAGLAGSDPAALWLFALFFIFWVVVLEPGQFPRSQSDWRRPGIWLAVASRCCLQLLVLGLLFGIGRGIGGVYDTTPEISTALPPAISFMAIPLARLIHDPWAVRSLPLSAEARYRFAQGMLHPLEELPPEVPDAELIAHLSVLQGHLDPTLVETVLAEKTLQRPAPAILSRALSLLQEGRAEAPDWKARAA